LYGRTVRARLIRLFVCAFCAFHMLAVVAMNLPLSSAFGTELRAPFLPYLVGAGLWQSWQMFDAPPRYGSFVPRLVARFSDGSLRDYDAMLPGLHPYRFDTRMSSVFIRYTWPTPDLAEYVRGYLHNACAAIALNTGRKPVSTTLRLDGERLTRLDLVRSTGRMTEPSKDFSSVIERCP
jgi:hypothetical protein